MKIFIDSWNDIQFEFNYEYYWIEKDSGEIVKILFKDTHGQYL